ncbi:MAG: zeta toxin family protein [Bacteroidales bacterium]|jgi:predicted ABC-type ATPase|nr:zeta toxin family protein [Bacteroidales bacterium]
MPNLYIIAGCNGAGKTTASYTVLPEMLQCKEFVNADEIARGLSPFNMESVAVEAGRIMLTRIEDLLDERVDFAFETTLASRSFVNLVKRAQQQGYLVSLVFFWLNSSELAIRRVAQRVTLGGHHIEEPVIRRIHYRGLYNLFNLYMNIVDYWILVDNTKSPLQVIAEKEKNDEIYISNAVVYNQISKNI